MVTLHVNTKVRIVDFRKKLEKNYFYRYSFESAMKSDIIMNLEVDVFFKNIFNKRKKNLLIMCIFLLNLNIDKQWKR